MGMAKDSRASSIASIKRKLSNALCVLKVFGLPMARRTLPLQIFRNCRKLFKRGLQIFRDFQREHVRIRQISAVFEAFIRRDPHALAPILFT